MMLENVVDDVENVGNFEENFRNLGITPPITTWNQIIARLAQMIARLAQMIAQPAQLIAQLAMDLNQF